MCINVMADMPHITHCLYILKGPLKVGHVKNILSIFGTLADV